MNDLRQRVMWENILFIPNIRDESWVEKLIALDKYKPRNIWLLGQWDMTVMNQSTQESIEDLLRLYGDLNIPHIYRENIVYVEGDKKISEMSYGMRVKIKDIIESKWSIWKLVSFIDSTATNQLAQYLGLSTDRNRTTSEIINNKYIAQSELRRRWVTVPDGRLVYNGKEALSFFRELRVLWYDKIAIKLLRAASGMGVFPVSTEQELEEFFSGDKIPPEEITQGILIDGWVKWTFISSPNIQFYVGKSQKEDIFISCSDQILWKSPTWEWVIHKWNISDPNIMYSNDKLISDLERIKNWVREVGAYGIIGIDFVVVEDLDTQEQKAYFMEINGRVNGSTPGAILTNTLTGNHLQTSWGINNNISIPWVKTPWEFISYLEKEKLLYDPISQIWVLPTNLSAIEWYDKAMVLVIGQTKSHVNDILNHLS